MRPVYVKVAREGPQHSAHHKKKTTTPGHFGSGDSFGERERLQQQQHQKQCRVDQRQLYNVVEGELDTKPFTHTATPGDRAMFMSAVAWPIFRVHVLICVYVCM